MNNPNVADLSLFLKNMGQPDLCPAKTAPLTSMSVFNSGAAPLLQEYDTAKNGSVLCDKYITQMQAEENFPADLLTAIIGVKDKYNGQLLDIKQKIMEQTESEPLDAFDRGIIQSLSDAGKADLESVLAADEVYQRALEMRAEQSAATSAKDKKESLSEISKNMTDAPAEAPAMDAPVDVPAADEAMD